MVNLTPAEANKIESIQRKILELCYNRIFLQIHYSYVSDLDHLHFHYLYTIRRYTDALFLVNICNGFTVFIPYLILLAFVFPLQISEIFLCLQLVTHVKLVPLIDVHEPQIMCEKI
jgi:hypothetical protein